MNDHTEPPQTDRMLPTAPPPTLACDGCHALLATGVRYQRLILGLNDDIAGVGPEHAPTVEEITELVFCEKCRARVSDRVDALLEDLWAHRQDLEVTS